MILKYVLKNFRRRRVRTLLMVLSLIVSTGLIVAMSATVETIRRSNVNLVATSSGRYDLVVRRTETSPEQFIQVEETGRRVLAADRQITAVHPRFNTQVELSAGGRPENGTLLALDPAEELGQIEVISGDYRLGEMRAAVLQGTALSMGNLEVGDTIEVAYSFPLPREKGSVSPAGGSQRRATGRFTISAIVLQNGVASAGFRSGLIVHIDDAQSLLGLAGRAQELIVLVEPALYEAGDAETAALNVRDVAVSVQAALGEDYVLELTKAQALDGLSEIFLVVQALISTYGLMSLGVVGLLVYTLVMTNVQEQRREMAILRILGGQQKLLFGIVVAEVLVVGLVGVCLGVLLGQAITSYAVVPFIEYQMGREGLVTTIQPAVSLAGILPAVLSAFLVLVFSALRPAQDAARTKVIHAINPSVADNIQLEDLESLRERRPTLKLFVIGLAMVFVVLLAAGLIYSVGFENPSAMAALTLVALIFAVVGIVFCFYILTRPLEKLILLLAGLVSPRLAYFAHRNVARSTERNTLISLLVLFAGVLPSFLATQTAFSQANIETDVRLDTGAPVEIRSRSYWLQWDSAEFAAQERLRPSFATDELPTVPGIGKAVGISHEYSAEVSDAVGMRTGRVTLVGVSGDLNDVLYEDLMVFSAGGPAALSQILTDPQAVIISQGMAEGLAMPLGGAITVQGAGLDHQETLTVVGIAQRLPGFVRIGQIRSVAMNGGTALVSLQAFRRLITPPGEAEPAPDDPVLDRALATLSAGADPLTVERELHETLADRYPIWTRLSEMQWELRRDSAAQGQLLLLALTLLSFVTAVFGVFAVIYVTVYARRREIGMMKAFGARGWELNGMLSLESIAMALSAALAGILAGSTTGTLLATAMNIAEQRPQRFAVDTTVMPFVVVMVTLASILATVFSARRIVVRRAVDILQME